MSTESSESVIPSMRDLLNVLFEHKFSMLLVFFETVGVVAFLVFFLLSPKFSSEAIILVDMSDVIRPVVNAPPKSDFEKLTDFHTQKDILMSKNLIANVARDLNLAEVRTISRIESIRMWVSDVKRSVGHVLGIEKWTKPYDPEEAAISGIRKRLKVSTSPESQAITIRYQSYNPHEAADVINKLIEHYEVFFYQRIQGEASGILAFIEDQIGEVRQSLASSEVALLDFRRKDSINLRAEATAADQGNDAGFIGITDSIEVQDEFKLYILKMEEELRTLNSELPPGDIKIRDLKEKIRYYVKAVNKIPEKELQLHRLRRELELNQESYIILTKNLTQARVVALSQANKIGLVKVLEEARADESPVSPKRNLALVLSIILGIGLSLAYVYMKNFFQHTLRTPADIQRNLGLRNLASLPEIE